MTVTDDERREVAEDLWRPVSGFDKYEVSKNGDIRNTKTGKLLSQYKNCRGYKKVCLYLDGKKKYLFAHRIVAMAFIKNDYPDTCTQVNHINEDKGDNRVENLEWVTPSENINHGTCIERRAKSQSRTVEMTYRGIRVLFDSTRDASERTGIARKAIQDVCRGKCKTTNGASFRYVGERYNFIDPEPERTCRIVRDYLTDTSYCDVCGERFDSIAQYMAMTPSLYSVTDYEPEYKNAKFCPNCGAKVVEP